MSSTAVDELKRATNDSTIYGGFFLFIVGMIGNILNIIIFTSLRTFRETSAAFYMTATSAVNIFQLVVGLLSRILITGYNIDLTKTSSALCKIRQYILITTMLIAFSCMCFAAIDQFFSLTYRWRHLCNVSVASRLVIIMIIVCCVHGIPVFFFQEVTPATDGSGTTCGFTTEGFFIYYSRILFPVFLGFLPLLIRIAFGLLAFINVRRFHNHQIPIIRLERDKQLTAMVFVEVVVDIFFTLPYSIYNHLYSSAVIFSDPVSIAQNQMIIAVTRVIFYGNFSASFYIYYCVSSRFRKQLAYVLIDVHLKHWRERVNRLSANQIGPEPLEMQEIPPIKLSI